MYSNPTLSAIRRYLKKNSACPKIFGEMSELAEGARLEIVCAVKSGTEGSNPSLSAKKKQEFRLGNFFYVLSCTCT